MIKKVAFAFFFILLVSSLVNAQEGGNIEASGIVDLNVTLVNAGPFYKFVLINPDYEYTLIRKGNEIVNVNNMGFWIAPYETLQVNVKIDEDLSVSSVSGVEGPNLFYSPVYPELVLYPQKYYMVDTFFISDGYVKVVEYTGSVKVTVKNPLAEEVKYIAVGIPILFDGAEIYEFEPEYTMKYSEYVDVILSQYAQYVREFMPTYLDRESENNTDLSELSSRVVVYSLTDNLLAKSKEKPEVAKTVQRSELKFDYPVWIVFLGGHDFEYEYRVKWENLMWVSEFGREKEKTFRFIMDRRNPQ
ncbi:hypothetical protein K1720_02540 [Thermococcus argininiproducens]|uniref:Uncharacterized protein n=1 Tax=Thermococcus argininiproducens TaxID=2866384 RepID=A0A9E7MB27_9EURY|nr:hypothetical protein [Thermococcus argininiproducens]USH00366.1 hypothetical protein K1720_02540 [Thermococcus argininiproducens]